MLTHVVLFCFPDLEVAAECRDRMLAMKGRIPALLDIEVGVDIVRSGRSFDLALITRHEDLAGMEAYQVIGEIRRQAADQRFGQAQHASQRRNKICEKLRYRRFPRATIVLPDAEFLPRIDSP